MRRILLLCLTAVSLFASSELWAQERSVTGRVTATEDGSALPGVNVVLKGTINGTVTDADGKYSLTVPTQGGILVFSFIGLTTQEIEIGDRSVVDLTMTQDARQLAEVVVTAQGIEKSKNELTYAAQKVNGDEVSRTRDGNFVNALSGKVAGLQITKPNTMGGSTNIVIRGNKSLTGNNQALFVIDGVPIDNSNNNTLDQTTGRGGYDYGNAAADINSDDIETLTVLKGAAATALYGSRAANGVIFITTKKGTKKGIGLSLNTGLNVGVIDKSTFPTYQNKYGGGYGKYYGPDGDTYFNQLNNDPTTALDPTSEDASYGAPFDKNLMVYQWDAFDPTSPNYGKPTPWVAAKNGPITFLNNPVSTNNNVMIDGGGDKGFFKLGYTQNKENGLLPNSSIKKDFINFSSSFNLSEKLSATASINYTNVAGNGRYGTGYDPKNVMTNFRQWWQVNTDLKEQEDAYNRTHQNVTWNMSGPPDVTAPIYWDNPYWTRYQNTEKDNRARYYGYTRLDYKATDWLSFMGRISLDSYNDQQEEKIAVGSIPSSLTTLNDPLKPGSGDPQPSGYSKFLRTFKEFNYDLMANFNKNLSRNFNLKAVLGSNVRRTTIETTFAATNGGLVVPNLYSLSNTLNAPEPTAESLSDLQVNGLYANLTLGFKSTLFLDVAARRDKASSLPKSNNTYYYPSTSLGFVFSELMKSQSWLTVGKVRVSYAEVGASAPTRSIKDSYTKPTAFGSVPLFSIPNTKNNPDLKPEKTQSFEVGLEMSFMDARFGFDATYYKQNTVDQILPVDVSRATGYNTKYVNAGNVQNQGIEVTAFVVPVKTPDFTWTVNVNWTRNRNKVIDLGGLNNLLLGSFQGGVSLNATVGQPYGILKGDDYIYTNGQRTVDQTTGYYLKTSTTSQIIGNINPNWIGGVMNTFKYKNVSLGVLVDVKNGGQMFSLDMYYGLATGLYPETAGVNDLGNPSRLPINQGGGVILPGVDKDGNTNEKRASNTNYGLYGYRRNAAKGFVYDAGYVKLREVSVNYSFPKSFVSKLGPIKGIDLAFVGRNLWIINKSLPYADPEDQMSAGNIQGYQTGAYPNLRNMGFNLKVRF